MGVEITSYVHSTNTRTVMRTGLLIKFKKNDLVSDSERILLQPYRKQIVKMTKRYSI